MRLFDSDGVHGRFAEYVPHGHTIDNDANLQTVEDYPPETGKGGTPGQQD